MAKQDSSKTVFLALSVNFFIGLIKSFVAFITNSSAMFSEAVHSFVDSFNQFLLWFGIKQTKKSNPKLYPLGRGREEYFWTLVVAVLIFTVGGLVSLEHGIEALSHPKELDNLYISISILSISIVLETYVLIKAVKKLRGNKEKKPILKLLKESKNLESLKSDIGWGHQIRSYVFHPYNLVKDHRTKKETGNVSSVMDGELDGFIYAYLLNQLNQNSDL